MIDIRHFESVPDYHIKLGIWDIIKENVDTKENFCDFFNDIENESFLIAFDHGKVVGFICFEVDSYPKAMKELVNDYVTPIFIELIMTSKKAEQSNIGMSLIVWFQTLLFNSLRLVIVSNPSHDNHLIDNLEHCGYLRDDSKEYKGKKIDERLGHYYFKYINPFDFGGI